MALNQPMTLNLTYSHTPTNHNLLSLIIGSESTNDSLTLK
jgi:hypothetical protein